MLKQNNMYIWVYKIFAKTLKASFFWHFWALRAHLNFFSKTGIRHFSYFMLSDFMKKIRKNW